MVIVLMGPAGAGKSTVAAALSACLGWRWVEGDDHHAATSIAKMQRGEPLTDADRTAWLSTLRSIVERAIDRREPLILACSALKEDYRVRLASGLRLVRFVYLKADREVLLARLTARQGHFAHANLLDSQLAALEEPGAPAVTVNASADPDTIVGHIRLELGV